MIREGQRSLLSIAALILGLSSLACSRPVGDPSPDRTSPSPGAGLSEERMLELRLTRVIPEQVGEACADARRHATVEVLCPRLIPSVPITQMRGSYGAIVLMAESRFYMLNFDKDFFRRPRHCGGPDAIGNCPGVQHWITGGGEADVVEKWVLTDFANEVEGNPTLVESREIDGYPVLVYRFPPYPAGSVNGDHWAAFVGVDDQLIFASLHGRRYVDAAVEMALDLARHADVD